MDGFKDEWYGVFETLPFPVTVNDNNYNIVKANSVARKLFGLDEKSDWKCYQVCDGLEYPPENCACGWGSKKTLVFRENSRFLKLPCQTVYLPIFGNSGLKGFVNILIPDSFEFSNGDATLGQIRPKVDESENKRTLGLSPRESQVIEWLKEGKSNWEIARLMEISEDTVKYHLKSIMRKLNVVNRVHAVARVMEHEMQKATEFHETRNREINHRVKNSLSSLKSLVFLKRSRNEGKSLEEGLLEIENRLATVAELYDELSKDRAIESVHAPTFISRVVTLMTKGFVDKEKPIEVDLKVENMKLAPDMASACGFILNELITNCLRHAFSESGDGGDGQSDKITVKLKKADGGENFCLTVSDNGNGFRNDPAKERSLGLELVELMAAQAEGTVKYSGAEHKGAEVRVDFK